MGDFLIIIPARDRVHETKQAFYSAIHISRKIKLLESAGITEKEWYYAASFPRANHSDSPIVADPGTGNWLLTIGSWFHKQGYSSGDETRLLKRLSQIKPQVLGAELEGFFVIVFGNAQTREISVITDLMGSCHCYSRNTIYGTAISSSSMILVTLGNFTLDPVGVQEFLYTGVIYEDRTFYKEIQKMQPCRVHTFFDGRLNKRVRYWHFEDIEPDSLDNKSAVDKLSDALVSAALKIGQRYKNPVCDLTGGYDSRATIAGFLSAGVKFSSAVSGAPDHPDVLISKGLSRLINVPNLHSTQSGNLSFSQLKEALPYTDGECELSEYYHILAIHRRLSDQFDISINGSFGEIGRGYWWELLFPDAGKSNKLDTGKIARLRYAALPHDTSIFSPEKRLDLISHFSSVIKRTNKRLTHLPNTAQMDHAYLMMRMHRWQGRIASSTNHLWPCLSPFLFRSVLEPMLASKTKLRKNGLLIREMLVKLQPEVAAFPLEHGYPALPVTIYNFYRFWPVVHYYQHRIARKIFRNFAFGSKIGAPQITQRDQLWKEDEVQELLNFKNMQLSSLLDQNTLQRFLENSRRGGFSFDAQFLRVLTLEYTLAVLKDVGIFTR